MKSSKTVRLMIVDLVEVYERRMTILLVVVLLYVIISGLWGF